MGGPALQPAGQLIGQHLKWHRNIKAASQDNFAAPLRGSREPPPHKPALSSVCPAALHARASSQKTDASQAITACMKTKTGAVGNGKALKMIPIQFLTGKQRPSHQGAWNAGHGAPLTSANSHSIPQTRVFDQKLQREISH